MISLHSGIDLVVQAGRYLTIRLCARVSYRSQPKTYEGKLSNKTIKRIIVLVDTIKDSGKSHTILGTFKPRQNIPFQGQRARLWSISD